MQFTISLCSSSPLALTKAKADNSGLPNPWKPSELILRKLRRAWQQCLAFEAASKNSCAQVAADHEVSVKAFAEDLKALSDATQVLKSETGAAEGHMYSLFQVSASTVQTTMDLKVRSGNDGEASRPEGALCRSLSACFVHLSCDDAWCWCW